MEELNVETLEGASSLVHEWSALAERIDAPPFLHPGWTLAWAKAFGVCDLRLVTIRREGELVAALPMDQRRSGLHAPVNSHTPMFGPLAIDEQARDALLHQLFEHSCTNVELNLLDGMPHALGPIADKARANGRLVLQRTVARSPFIELKGEFEDFERRLSRNRRRGMRRHRRKLEQLGELSFEIGDDRERLHPQLHELFGVEGSGWKGERGTAIASNPDTLSFYTEIAEWAADRGWMRLAFLRLDGEPIACDYAFEHGGVWYTLKAGYDERFRSYGPGALLLRDELIHCFDSGLARVDLLGHEDPFKLSWTEQRAERAWLRAFRRSPAGLLAWSGIAARERLRAIKTSLDRSLHSLHAGVAFTFNEFAGVLQLAGAA